MTLRQSCLTTVWLALAIVPPASAQQSRFEEGVTPAQLSRMTDLLLKSPIYNLRLFREARKERLSAAILTVADGGWKVTVVSPRSTDGYVVTWRSPVLKDSFAVSSPKRLDTFGLEEGDGVVFSGCAPHQCPDIFSVLLYVPSVHKAFTAMCRDQGTTYSFRSSSEAATYQEPMNELLRGMSGYEQACSLEVQPEKKEAN